MRLPTKPSQTPACTPTLPIRLAIAIDVAMTSLAVFSARTISSRRMMFAGEKKWSPTTSCGRFVSAAIASTSKVEVLVAMMAPDFGNFIELAEHLLLKRHVFEHGLDDEVGLAEVGHLKRRRQLGEPIGRLRRRNAAALGVGRKRVLDARHALVERLLRRLDDGDGKAGIEERQRDAGAHGAGAQDADGLNVAQLRLGPMPGKLAACRSAKKAYCRARA